MKQCLRTNIICKANHYKSYERQTIDDILKVNRTMI